MVSAAAYNTDTSDTLIPHGLFRGVFTTAGGIIEGAEGADPERSAAVQSYFGPSPGLSPSSGKWWPRTSERRRTRSFRSPPGTCHPRSGGRCRDKRWPISPVTRSG